MIRQAIYTKQFLSTLLWPFVVIFLLWPSIILLAATPYTPQYADPVLEPWRWTSYPELKGQGLRCIAEDSTGAIWFGINNGIIRYNGTTWTTYTSEHGLHGNSVKTLLTSRDGTVYAGTELGISKFENAEWQPVFSGHLDTYVSDLMQDSNGHIWAGTNWGALKISEGNIHLFTTQDIADGIRMLAPQLQTTILPEHAAPLRMWKTDLEMQETIQASSPNNVPLSNTIWNQSPGSPAQLAGLHIGDQIISQAIIRSESTATSLLTLSVIRSGQSLPKEIEIPFASLTGTFRDFNVHDIIEDRDGTLWFALRQGEMITYNPQENVWQGFDGSQGLALGKSPRILQAKDGTIWSISEALTTPINKYDGKTWTTFDLGYNLHTSILQTDDGTIWIGGITITTIKNGRWYSYRSRDFSSGLKPIPGSRFDLLKTSEGALWLAGWDREAVCLDLRPSHWTTYKGLIFLSEQPDGTQWFISEDGGAVQKKGDIWTRYDTRDGLMQVPLQISVTSTGEVWAGGSQDSTSATAQFDGKKWSLQLHPQLSWGIEIKGGIYESPTGDLWFLGARNRDPSRGHLGGAMRYRKSEKNRDQQWSHHAYRSGLFYGVGQTKDGKIWFGGPHFRQLDGTQWTTVREPVDLAKAYIDAICTTANGNLWVGTRGYGIFSYNGQSWTQYDIKDGLPENAIWNIIETRDESIWAQTNEGISRFDGRNWVKQATPESLPGNLKGQTQDGALWFNKVLAGEYFRQQQPGFTEQTETNRFLTIRYGLDTNPPETKITHFTSEISQPGNTTITWEGADPWRNTPDQDLQFSHRLNNGHWSSYSTERYKTFLSLPSGTHTFQVKARDREFNADPTPTTAHFTVIPPVYQQPWFIGLMIILASTIAFQTTRVIRRDRRLQEANTALSDANKELFEVNVTLEKANTEIQQQSERKSTFLASMSHELRTPLNAIKGFASLVARRAGDVLPQQQKDNLQKVDQASDHLLAMINDLLDLSKIEAGRMDVNPTTFNVKKLIASCVSTVSPLVQEGVQLGYEIADDIGDAYTDEARVRQMVINLLSNAVKFTEEGEVKVIVTGQKSKSEIAGGESDRRETKDPILATDFLEIAVSDTGQGIPQDELPTIFDEYRQVKGSESSVQKGTGLGLSITRKFAELLGGNISAESEIGKGSTFTVKIPVVYGETE